MLETPSVLEAQISHFGYPNAPAVLSDLHLSVSSAERVVLSGHSGRGKTTLCKLLAGYLTPHQGQVSLDGQPLQQATRAAGGVSPVQMIWQHPELAVDPRMKMQETLAEAGSVSEELLERLQINSDWLTRYPHELSGGELQRFCLARALATQPRFLIADEISTMLDAVTQAQIWQVILEEVQRWRIGLVFVSHSPALNRRLATRLFKL